MTPRFGALFFRQVVRHALRRPWLSLLNIASIALGVTVFLAIQIANRSALESFDAAAKLTAGKAHLEVRGDISDELLPTIAGVAGIKAVSPLVEGIITLPDAPGEYLRVLGVDPFEGRDLFAFKLQGANHSNLNIEEWLSNPSAIALNASHASTIRRYIKDGKLTVLAGTTRREVEPIFEISTEDALSRAEPRLAAMDISWAQELLRMSGKLTTVQILLEDESLAEPIIQALREILPADLEIAPPVSRSQEMEIMVGAFQLNLTAMSLVSIVVGMFLISNSVGASVIRKRHDIAILRATGATRWEIRFLFLGEALLEALLGATLALFAAPWLAELLSAPLSQTVSSLYDVVRLTEAQLHPSQILLAYGVGLGAALLAAWLPASEAASVDPARILHPGAAIQAFSPRLTLLTALAILMGGIAFGLSYWSLQGGPKELGFIAAAAVIGAFSCLAPHFAHLIALFFRPWGLLSRMASDHLVRSLHRNSITIAALSAAVAMTVSVTVMIHSFRASVGRWIDRTLAADLYIAPAANEVGGLRSFLPNGIAEWAETQPQVKSVALFREIPLKFEDHPVHLAVLGGRARGDLEILPGSEAGALESFENGKAVLISESFASRFGSRSTLSIPTPKGVQAFPVAGIYKDFTRESGTIQMDRKLYERFWDDARLHSVAITLHNREEGKILDKAFRKKFGNEGAFSLYDNAALRQRILDIFDGTFAVTSVLRMIAIVVAITGILFSLTILATEREREIGVLRAVGASFRQVLTIFLTEAGLIGLTASICGTIAGAALSMVLTWVVNKAFFGWTIALSYPIETLLITPVWLVPAALVAALIPSLRAAATAPAKAVRFE